MAVKLLVKPLLYSVFFFTDHVNHKTVNKTTFRMPSANPYQLCIHYFESNQTVVITF